ncbi:rhodanese-like domain-containing protein [Accumulibacter sp.]|uniref:rhodanese-like domain-containing protein n=1 Tax=Accumulibacter sp. TaxID=2053492 RepID=UPI0025EC347B|nr:rhodanese-like domain-containing protein [Accumulibacter sp.]MCM8627655.1 rhodanese-like domain-containing protein [Accumulibacter sp.]
MIARLLVPLFALLFAAALRAEVVDIGNAELARLLAAGVPLVDIRTEAEWKQTGVVPGSRLITLFDERGRADAPAWLQKMGGVAPANQPVIVICRSGNRTRAASRILAEQGDYQKVYNVSEGIRGWAGEGRPMTPAPAAVASCPPGASC